MQSLPDSKEVVLSLLRAVAEPFVLVTRPFVVFSTIFHYKSNTFFVGVFMHKRAFFSDKSHPGAEAFHARVHRARPVKYQLSMQQALSAVFFPSHILAEVSFG